MERPRQSDYFAWNAEQQYINNKNVSHTDIFFFNMFSKREEMDFAGSHYYRINQILLSMLKLWPYQQSKFAIINHVLCLTLMLSFIFFQYTSLFTSKLTLDFVIMVLSYAVPSLIHIVQYRAFYSKQKAVRQMWNDIRYGWSILKNTTERDIMRQYSSTGEMTTIVVSRMKIIKMWNTWSTDNSRMLLVSIVLSLIVYSLIEFLPTILDAIAPLNETRSREMLVVTEYFVDQRMYYYPILCHWLIGLSFSAFVIMATNTLLMIYIDHICGLLRIVSYRIEHSVKEYASLRNSMQNKDRTACQRISSAMEIHRKALKNSEHLINTFTSDVCVTIIIGVTSLSLNLFRLLRAIVLMNSINDLVTSIIFICVHFLLLFVSNYYAQKITDHNNEIFSNTYNTQWYTTSIKVQKLLLFIMQNTTKPYILNIGNLIMGSLEGFAKMSSMAISYFTMIYSLL